MPTGWRIESSDGGTFTSWSSAADAARSDLDLTFTETWFDARGYRRRDVTGQVRRLADRQSS